MRLHRDESGSMSIVAVFTLLVLVMLLGMVMNSGMQIEQRVRLQNAADAVAYSGGTVFTRNVNTIAFTNHLLGDVFALTSFMRESRDRRAESLTPEILDNWERIGRFMFRESEFTKFQELGLAIGERIPPDRLVDGDREMIQRFGDWSAAGSELMLPVFETLLSEQAIPQFQRTLVDATPAMMQVAASSIARRHNQHDTSGTELHAVVWCGNGLAVEETSGLKRVLPVVDAELDEEPNQARYRRLATEMRFRLAHTYMRDWNNESMDIFDKIGQMSRFSSLWRILTGGELERLLNEEYPTTNLPMVLRHERTAVGRSSLEEDYMFVGAVYRQKHRDLMPGVFGNPISADRVAYAQVFSFVPRRRLVYAYQSTGGGRPGASNRGGIPGQNIELPPGDETAPPPPPPENPSLIVVRQSGRYFWERWSAENQNWTVQLTPATCRQLPAILSRVPASLDGVVTPPDLSGLSYNDILWLSHH